MEEIKVMEQVEVEEQQVTEETPEEEQGNGIIDTIIGFGTLAAIGLGAWFGGRFLCRKHADKVQRETDKKIADLEKQGYIITKPETEGEATESEAEK